MYVEALVAHKRDILTKTKQARDGLRMDNLKLRQRCGLLGNDDLLRDFEDKVDTSEARNVDAEMHVVFLIYFYFWAAFIYGSFASDNILRYSYFMVLELEAVSPNGLNGSI
ncbi:UNVERIFIED_CONTAM: hypothetical protein FKN15_029800 [Acipenser sinensis]